MSDVEDLEKAMQDLRAVIHSLRMNNLAYVETDAIDEIEAMVKVLPTPEELNGLAMAPESIQKVQDYVGGILRLVELYSRRDGEYKARYISRTGLPPRYKVLEWRKTMSRDIRNGIVKDLVQLSSEADKDGNHRFASSLLSCAKTVRSGGMPVDQLHQLSNDFLRENMRSGIRTAQASGLPALRDPGLGGIRDGLEQIQLWFGQIEQAFQEKLQYLSQAPSTQKFTKQLANIWRGVSKLEQSTSQQIDALQQPMAEIEQAMEQTLIPQSIMFQNKVQPISWVPDPDDPGMDMAVIDVDGQQYEVHSDESGNLSVHPPQVEPTQQEVEPQAPDTTQQQEQLQPQAPQTTQQGQTDLESLNRGQLSTMIQQFVPEVWQSGYNGKAVGALEDGEMRAAIKEHVGAGSLQSFIDKAVAASANVFNLKRYSSRP